MTGSSGGRISASAVYISVSPSTSPPLNEPSQPSAADWGKASGVPALSQAAARTRIANANHGET
jgi:hypothetical protein